MDNHQENRSDYYVSQQEPQAKPPPALETGVIKWIRDNLFNSILNSVLTIVGVLLVVYVIVGLSNWIVRDANWFAISANIRNYMLGRFEREYEWRASLALFFSIFAMGAAVAVWVRQIARPLLIGIVVILLGVQVLPRLTNNALELPSWYSSVGNVEVVSGSSRESSIDSIAFIGEEGDSITISFANADIESEESLADLHGFVDNVANTLRNAAANRLQDIDTITNFTDLIAQDDEARSQGGIPTLTTAQYEAYSAEVASTEIPDPIIEAYHLNVIPVRVQILDPETMEPVRDGEQVLQSPEDRLSVTLPRTGWFILVKTLVVEEASVDEGVALLDVQGIYPAAKRETTNSLTFTRRPDGLEVYVDPPTMDGDELPFIDAIRNQYRGERPFTEYLRGFIGPFLLDIANYITIVLAVGIAGHVFAQFLQTTQGKEAAATVTTYMLALVPVVIWILINGIYLYSVFMWLLFIALCLACYVLFKLAQKNGMNPALLVGAFVIYGIFVAVLWVTGSFDLPRLIQILPLMIEKAAIPRLLVWLGIIFLPVAVLWGASVHIPREEIKFNLFAYLLITAILVLTVLVVYLLGIVTQDTVWLLEPSNPADWGGLLLTFMLTIYGIIIAFPIGISLALGRRSDLPLIKYLCTAYIELVRGSPFITVLFFMQLFIPLISPDFSSIPGSYRAIAATIAFSAAYLAENVRGGLQSLPPGQTEAAKALGLNPWQTVNLITMPQALRAVIPALVGQFISLFKDTTLVAIVGLIDLVGFVNAMVVQPQFIGTRLEGLFFISILFFVVSYIMSYVSRLLEASGSGSTRRM